MGRNEWTPAIGVRNLSIRLLIRSVAALVIWTPMVWLVTPGINALPGTITVWAIVGFVLVIAGLALGYGLCRDISEIAGFSGLLLFIIAVLFIIATAYAAMGISHMLRPIEEWQRMFLVAAPAGGGAAYALKAVLVD